MQSHAESPNLKRFQGVGTLLLVLLIMLGPIIGPGIYLYWLMGNWKGDPIPYVADPKFVLAIPTTGKWAGKAIYLIESDYANIKKPKPHNPLLKMQFRMDWYGDAETQSPTFRLASLAEIRQLPLPYIASYDGGNRPNLTYLSIKTVGDKVEIHQTTLSQDTACVYDLTPSGPHFLSTKVFGAVEYY